MKNIILILILFCTASLVAVPNNKEVYIKVYAPEVAWADSKIESKIIQSFSSHSNINVHLVGDNSSEPEFPDSYVNSQNMIEWGKEIGSRFVMVVDVQSERIERRKTFHIPLIIHKYQTYGIIEGEMRLYDITRNKMIKVHSFKVEEKGSRIFQATMDDDINDPDLHITAPNKIKFFSNLEDKLVVELKKNAKVLLGLR